MRFLTLTIALLGAVVAGVAVLVGTRSLGLGVGLALIAVTLESWVVRRVAVMVLSRLRAIERRLGNVVTLQRADSERIAEIVERQRKETRVLNDVARTVGRSAPLIRTVATATSQVKPRPKFELIRRDALSLLPKKMNHARWASLRVATILDEFSASAFAPEWSQHPISRSDWRSDLETIQPHLLFVESAWNGNGGDWAYQLVGESAPRHEIVELVSECRRRGIPTVFWNKEDPVHFKQFLATARLFDVVFTSDGNTVADYQRELGHDRVHLLQFAAQADIHNPVRIGKSRHARDVAFGGMYFAHTHRERREQMDLLLSAAVEAGEKMEKGLDIFSRQHGGDKKYQFPAPFDAHVVGGLSYEQMLGAYRLYKVFLNVNTIVSSPTMCARRVFEISASGTPVVSTASPAIQATFRSDEVAEVQTHQEAVQTLRHLVRNGGERDRMVHRAQRRIWRNHTYSHRVAEIVSKADIAAPIDAPVLPSDRTVSVVVPTIRPGQLDHILGTFARQKGVDAELLVLTHGFVVPEHEFKEACNRHGVSRGRVLAEGRDKTLGYCLNSLVGAAEGDVVAKMDDDDFYGDQYLADSVSALYFSRAGLVGKEARYLYLAGRGVTILRSPEREHVFTKFVSGPTMMAERELLADYKFADVNRGEDSRLLAALDADRVRVYSSDRFNFAQIRASNGTGHTWDASDLELLAGSDIVGQGWLADEVTC